MRRLKEISFTLVVVAVICGFYFIRGDSLPFMAVVGRSMEPVLKQGDLIFTEAISPTQVKVGDIVVFDVDPSVRRKFNYPPVVAHRVIKVNTSGDRISLCTKGDNTGKDPFTVNPYLLRGKVSQQVSYLGFPIMFLQSGSGQIFVLIALLVLALYLYGDSLIRGGRKLQTGLLAPVIEETQRSNQVVVGALEEFASAMKEYAQHLKSHTSAIISLSQASQELSRTTEEQNKLLGITRQSQKPDVEPSAPISLEPETGPASSTLQEAEVTTPPSPQGTELPESSEEEGERGDVLSMFRVEEVEDTGLSKLAESQEDVDIHSLAKLTKQVSKQLSQQLLVKVAKQVSQQIKGQYHL